MKTLQAVSAASRVRMFLFGIPILLLGLLVPISNAQEPQTQTRAVQLMGLVGVKDTTRGTLAIENGNLRFTHSGDNSDLVPSSMQDVATGSHTQRVIRGTLGTLSMFAPYGSGRFLSLFRTKVDTLTIQYRDAKGGLHGVIFTMPVGTAETREKKLLALGAHAGNPIHERLTTDISSRSGNADPRLDPPEEQSAKISASAIKVMMIESDETRLPAEFKVALYENLIRQLQKKGGFQNIYRDGDPSPADEPTLVVLHSTVRGFKKGSEMARQVTTVAGATTISVHCQFTDKDGQILLARDIKGEVRFFGGNLKATYDFAKKASSVTYKNFFPMPEIQSETEGIVAAIR
jgi:hypothetical protein